MNIACNSGSHSNNRFEKFWKLTSQGLAIAKVHTTPGNKNYNLITYPSNY